MEEGSADVVGDADGDDVEGGIDDGVADEEGVGVVDGAVVGAGDDSPP